MIDAAEGPPVEVRANPGTEFARGRLFPAAVVFAALALALRYGLPFLSGMGQIPAPVGLFVAALVGLGFTFGPVVAIRVSGERVFDGMRRPRLFAEIGAAVVMLLPLLVAIAIFSGVFQKQLATQPDEQAEQLESLTYSGDAWRGIAFAVAACVWAPLVEEILCRRLLFRGFSTRWGLVPGAILSSTVFALVHSYGELRTIAIFGVGMTLCGIYAWRKTLLAPMLLHAMFNGIFVIALFLQMAKSQTMPYLGVGGEERPEGLLIVAVEPQSSAGVAGVQPGDVLTTLDGARTRTMLDVKRALEDHHPGDDIEGTVLRAGDEIPLTFRLKSTVAEAAGQGGAPQMVP